MVDVPIIAGISLNTMTLFVILKSYINRPRPKVVSLFASLEQKQESDKQLV